MALSKIDISKAKDLFKQIDIVNKCNIIVKEISSS